MRVYTTVGRHYAVSCNELEQGIAYSDIRALNDQPGQYGYKTASEHRNRIAQRRQKASSSK